MSVIDGEVRVGGSDHGQRVVAKDLLQKQWVSAPAEKMGSVAMTEQVRLPGVPETHRQVKRRGPDDRTVERWNTSAEGVPEGHTFEGSQRIEPTTNG